MTSKLREERERSARRELVTHLLQGLERECLNYCVLKNYLQLPELDITSDIDLIIDRHQIARAERALVEVAVRQGLFLYSRINRHISVSLHFDGAVGGPLVVDLLTDIEHFGTVYLSGQRILASKARYREFFVASRVHTAIATWVQSAITGKRIIEKYESGFLQAAKSDGAHFRAELEQLFGRRIGRLLWEHFERGEVHETLAARTRLRLRMVTRQLFLNFPDFLSRKSRFLRAQVRLKARPTGPMIALIGPDGCGKSTVAAMLKEQIQCLVHSDLSQVLHLKPGWLPPLARVFRPSDWGKPLERADAVPDPHSSRPSGLLGSLARLFYYLIDYTVGYFRLVRPKRARNAAIIFERYYYDFIVDPRRGRIQCPLWLRRWLLWLVPKPSKVIYLHAPPEVLFRRKPELTLEELRRQTTEFAALVDELPQGCLVDATQPIEDVVCEVYRACTRAQAM